MSKINEENIDFQKAEYSVPSQFQKELGLDKITGNNILTKIARYKKMGNLSPEAEKAFKWLESKNRSETDKIYAQKDIIRKTDGVGSKKGGNAFKDTHEKKGSPNPDKIGGLAKLTSSGKHSKVSDQIEQNKVTYYESFDAEIDAARYLIEYMDNKKTKI